MSRKQQASETAANSQVAGEVYVVVNPITYGDPEVRHKAGAEVSDIPAGSISWLLEQGHITRKTEVQG